MASSSAELPKLDVSSVEIGEYELWHLQSTGKASLILMLTNKTRYNSAKHLPHIHLSLYIPYIFSPHQCLVLSIPINLLRLPHHALYPTFSSSLVLTFHAFIKSTTMQVQLSLMARGLCGHLDKVHLPTS